MRDFCWPENAMEHNGTTKNEGRKSLQVMCMHSLSTKRGCKVRKNRQK